MYSHSILPRPPNHSTILQVRLINYDKVSECKNSVNCSIFWLFMALRNMINRSLCRAINTNLPGAESSLIHAAFLTLFILAICWQPERCCIIWPQINTSHEMSVKWKEGTPRSTYTGDDMIKWNTLWLVVKAPACIIYCNINPLLPYNKWK